MNSQMVGMAKIMVGASWLFAVACFFFPLYDAEIGAFGRLLFWALVGVHTLECIAFAGTLRKTDRPFAYELVQTFFFGVIHFGTVKQSLIEKEAAEG